MPGLDEGPRGALVEVETLTWRPYGAAAAVLDEVTLQVEPGDRVLLAGASGSGKSTLLRALAGVLEDTGGGELSGSVSISGCVSGSGSLSGPGQVGLLLQDPGDAVVARTVGRDVAFGPECAGVPRDATWARVHAALDAVTFPYAASHETRALSGGETQRLALAGVLALRPGLLLLDEPCSMLDPDAARAVRDAVVAAVSASGATLVVVEHRLEHWMDVCDRLLVLGDGGRVVADGPLRPMLAEQGAALAARGLWVPGVAAPQPLRVPTDLVGTDDPVLVQARLDRVERAVQPGLASWQVEHPPRVAVSSVSLQARPGEVVALTGASGAGKSTVLACLGGLLAPTAGEVSLSVPDRAAASGPDSRPGLGPDSALDQPRTSAGDAAHLGWVAQRPDLPIVARTVWDESLATARALGLEDDAARDRAYALLDLVGLGERHASDPHALSGGGQRRLSIVAALVHRPGLLLLDEPTVGQDRQTWAVVAGLAAAHAAGGGTVVMASHDRDLVAHASREQPLARPGGPVAEPRRRGQGLAAYASPLPLLLLSVVAAVVGLALPGVAAGFGVLGVELLVLLALCGLRWPQPVLRLVPLAIGAVSLWWSNWLWSEARDPVAALLPALRMTTAALPGVVLAGYLEPFALGDALGQRLHLPARPVVAATVALQRFDELRATVGELRAVRRVRGVLGRGVRDAAGLTFALLVLALRQAGRMAVAMEARGFSSAVMRSGGRTWAEPARWGRTDLGVVASALLVLLAGAVGHLA
ncbi:hypothetical protein ADJ73_06940 [Arsenicicoccus sp. oral taxon 190]|nr:hypothetical protein ADJ73_06940 [Arsenicicoccus sp. oral taxon 190]